MAALLKVAEEDPLTLAEENLLTDEDSESVENMAGVKDSAAANCFMRDTITALHR